MKKLAFIVAATAAVAITSAASAVQRQATDYPTATFTGQLNGRVHESVVGPVSTGTSGIKPLANGPIFNSNGFSAPTYTPGNLIGQNTWQEFLLTGATSGYTVSALSGVGGGQGVVANAVGTSFAFPTTPLIVPEAGQGVDINIDIARTVGTTAALSSANYNIDVYSSVNRITRFGLSRNATTNAINVFVTAPFNTTTGQFQAGQPVFNVTVTGALTPNTFYNLEAKLNYGTQMVDLFSNGSLFFGNIPFASAATDFSDADLSVGTGTLNDNGFFDNYSVSLITVPEPMSLSALALGGMLIARRRRD